MPKLVTIIMLIIFIIFVLVGLTRQITQALQAGKRLEVAIDEVNSLQAENFKLKNQLTKVQSTDYIDEIAHNKLNLSQNGEVMVIIPQEELVKALAEPQQAAEIKISNWQGWFRLFFK